jgi:hypothetical protein
MGTNYYLKGRPACAHCGRGGEREGPHIGKSSGGWAFALRIYPAGIDDLAPSPIADLPDWIPLFEKFGVIDEYGRDVPVADMLQQITERSHPHGLRHHDVEAHRCLGPGAGTWDRMLGEFS